MNNKERKEHIIKVIESQNFDSIHKALQELGSDIGGLEAVPFSLRNEVIRICEDLADGCINSQQYLVRLKAFVSSVPD
ncbi:hypothetical protein L1286_16975 [Pseudoalteromonas sp. SMS1]|uniref:hypothetical protein n=1 Tax=Pseudoalteromonas sp. SMS1 TaxID=2908894 RepID=UPI001F381843|nr:hypothetical protein [Pseudoalteromonas sp. SMS1]MCF2859179.1 hypothetical protein [Pseudoalteromonas sp. SMS1]